MKQPLKNTAFRPLMAGIPALIAFIVFGSSDAETASAKTVGQDGPNPELEVFKLSDRSNIRDLSNGDFLFRLARDVKTKVVYWAYMGSTREIIATVPDRSGLTNDTKAKAILLRIVDLPARVGCGVGQIHQSKVYVVPENAEFTGRDFKLKVSPVYIRGEVRNDVSGRTPTTLLSYRNFIR